MTPDRPVTYRVATDTGGTFTDFVVLDEDSGELTVVKVPSTPANPGVALLTGLSVLADRGVAPVAIGTFVHGTTVGTNALLEEKGAPVGLAVTAGFRGVYETMEQSRPFGAPLFDLGYTKPAPFAPARLTLEVDERVTASGEVELEADPEHLRGVSRRFRELGVESVAVCFLFSFLDDTNERALAAALADGDGAPWVTRSSRLLPQMREYHRLSTTVVNAYVSPVIDRYVTHVSSHLDERGVAPDRRFTMQSNGGSTPFEHTASEGVATILSGPAGGVTGTVALGRLLGVNDLIAFDMGGTSCDVALIQGAEPNIADRTVIGGRHIAVPMLEINTVSAGGGTIARVDEFGSLRVGPDSAGSTPGPAAYGSGGTEATVTDANVFLGYLSPTALLGGDLAVDRDAADRVIRDLAAALGVDPVRAAAGVLEVVNVTMGEAIRAISTERGFDLRDFTLVPYGGAGPLHASPLARELGVPRVVVPAAPGAHSALGLLTADVRHDHLRTRLCAVDDLDPQVATAILEDMTAEATGQLAEEGFSDSATSFRYFLDMRYTGQGYENPVPIEGPVVTRALLAEYEKAFHLVHERCHGHAAPDQGVEVVNYRVEASGLLPPVTLPRIEPAKGDSAAAIVEHRPVVFPDDGDAPAPTPVYAKAALRAGHSCPGPAIIEQYDSTIVVGPGQYAEVDAWANVWLSAVTP